MKKLLFLIPIMMLSLLMSSCKGDDGPMGPMGPVGPSGGGTYVSDYLEAKANNWELFGEDGLDASYYECMFSVPELTEDIYDYGLVNTFVELGEEKFQLNKTLSIFKQNGDLDYFIYYDYSYVKGNIFFRISYSDNIMRAPGDQLFYFVLEQGK